MRTSASNADEQNDSQRSSPKQASRRYGQAGAARKFFNN
jgi:hypothetical protein